MISLAEKSLNVLVLGKTRIRLQKMLLFWRHFVRRTKLLGGVSMIIISSWGRGFRAGNIFITKHRRAIEGVEVIGEEMGSEISGDNRSSVTFHESQ